MTRKPSGIIGLDAVSERTVAQAIDENAQPRAEDEFPIGPCEECLYGVFPASRGPNNFGDCRQKAPITSIVVLGPDRLGRPTTMPTSAWPVVGRRQGCGEFTPKPSKAQ